MSSSFFDSSSHVSDIVRGDYRTADVFKKHGINFCCSGNVSVESACSVRNIDCSTVLAELDEVTRNICLPNGIKFADWNASFLSAYIMHVHHGYLYQALPSLQASLHSFMEGHKKKFPQLEELSEIFTRLSNLLLVHIRHEDEIIFPYVGQIEAAYKGNESYGSLLVKTLRKPIGNIEREHIEIGELMKKLKESSNNFQFPANACTNHQVIYHRLKEFYEDMVQHLHLENNILYPKVKEIEQRLLGV
jgi:regulator of cell morphogenesis and NO signaling